MTNDGPTAAEMDKLADSIDKAYDVAIHSNAEQTVRNGEIPPDCFYQVHHLSDQEKGLLIIALRFCAYSAGFEAGPEYESDYGGPV